MKRWLLKSLLVGAVLLIVVMISLQAQDASEPTTISRNPFEDLLPKAKQSTKTTAGGLTQLQAECVLSHLEKVHTDTAMAVLLTICKVFPK